MVAVGPGEGFEGYSSEPSLSLIDMAHTTKGPQIVSQTMPLTFSGLPEAQRAR